MCTSCTHDRRHSSNHERFRQIYTPFRTDDQSEETEVIYQPKPGADCTAPTVTIDNNPLNVVDKFTYLGSTISQNALISARIGKASGSFGKLTKRLWTERGVPLITKVNVYCAVVLPTLLYGCEAWTPYRRHMRRLDQFHMRCLKPGVHTNDFATIHGRPVRIHTAPAEDNTSNQQSTPQALCEYGRGDRESWRNR